MNALRIAPLVAVAALVGIGFYAQNVLTRRAIRNYETPGIVIKPRLGTWSTHHPIPPSPPSGAAAVGDPGTARMRFTDITRQAGLNYRWTIPGPRPLDILQTIGNGCAFLDYDNSGNLSILLVGTDHVALYKGDGQGHFTDVSHQTHLDTLRGHFLGCAVGDYDNDGYDDIYVSGYRTGILLHNEHGQYFQDVTAQAGLTPQPWGTSCAWGETVPGSRRLDLFVGGYVQFDPKTSIRLCNDGLPGVCSPDVYIAEAGVFYKNLGNGRFRDENAQWKVLTYGKNLGMAFADYNGSGRQSLYVANDRVGGDLLRNDGHQFTNIGTASGTATDSHGRNHSGMGVDWGDYNNDGRLDLAVTAFQGEAKCVYRNLGSGLFEEVSDSLLLTHPTINNVAFGCKWADFGNDGWLDLMIANGAVQDNIGQIYSFTTFRQATQLFHNDHGRLFVDESGTAGTALTRPILGRGLTIGDFENDGRLGALVVDSEGAPLLLKNDSGGAGHQITLTLVGTHCNRDGYGALVTVKTPGVTQTRLCHADGSYLSSSDKRVHIGLGSARAARVVTVRWPDGHADTYRNVPADQFYRCTEGHAALAPGLPSRQSGTASPSP